MTSQASYDERPPLPDILTNKVKCLKCGEIIESKYRHDFVSCSCGNIAVDGGHEYLRRVGTLKDYEDLSTYA
jgi:DNA-directed RNA polymerase subunit N (RpoN/RPB10)